MGEIKPLAEQLAELKISTQKGFHWREGADQKLLCPQCQGGSTAEKSLSLRLDEQGGAVWQCHRRTCGWAGNVPGRSGFQSLGKPKAWRRPEPPRETPRPEVLLRWFEKRGIGSATVEKFGIYRTRHWIAQAEAEVPVTAFPYRHGGELVGIKYRYDYRKADGSAAKTFAQEKETEPTLYNADALNVDEVCFVEGEMDVLSCYEAGVTNAVSLRDGASSAREKSDRRYAALKTHWRVLKDVQRFILAGDMDEVGQAFMQELARRLGREKCRIVEWPEGCKDANETLVRHGAEAVRACIAAARPLPIEGLWNMSEDDIAVLDDDSWMDTLSTGSKALDPILKIPAQGGRFFVVTGVPNSGKSTWTDWLLVQQAELYGHKAALFSPETSPWQLHAQRLAEIHIGRPWRHMSMEQKVAAVEFCGRHFTHIVPDEQDDREVNPTLDWLIEQVRLAVLRDGVRNVLIDPWNELEHAPAGNESLTAYTNNAVRRLKRLCSRHGVNVFLVAHPKKMQPGDVPTGYSISDSAAFFNKADFGITIHRPDAGQPGLVHVNLWKVRFKAHGKKGTAFLLWQRENDRFLDAPEQPLENSA